MLKSIARVFEFKESSISKSTLRRITIALLLTIPAFPLGVMRIYDLFSNPIVDGMAKGLMIVGLICLIYCMSTRFVNRFYFPDKYLDEWEIGIKHKSMAFSFMIMFWVVPFVIVAALIASSGAVWEVSGIVVFHIGMAILLGLCYIQIFHALWQVRPFDQE
jgi:hypothetical protein